MQTFIRIIIELNLVAQIIEATGLPDFSSETLLSPDKLESSSVLAQLNNKADLQQLSVGEYPRLDQVAEYDGESADEGESYAS